MFKRNFNHILKLGKVVSAFCDTMFLDFPVSLSKKEKKNFIRKKKDERKEKSSQNASFPKMKTKM